MIWPCCCTAGTPLDLIYIYLKLLTKHEHMCIHMIRWLCLYKRAMHLHLLHLVWSERGWFPQTDPPLCGMPWHYKQASWKRRASVIVARGGGRRAVGAAGLLLANCVSLPAYVIIKMTLPPPVPVTVVASQRQQQSCYCLSFSWKDHVGQRAESFCSESWKIWCPAWAFFRNAPWEMGYLSSACKKPWH